MRDRFWVLPVGCALVAAACGSALTALDDRLNSVAFPALFAGGPEGARALLSAIITAMISFTGLVFSITIVVLQLTSSQFSPRVLRMFLRDRVNQLTLGVFVATFVYAVTVLRAVRGTASVEPFVPQLAMTVAILLVVGAVLFFLYFIHHIAQSIRVATIIDEIAVATRATLGRRHPEQPDPTPAERRDGPAREVAAAAPGVVQNVDDAALVRLAERGASSIRLLRAVGEFVPAGAPLLVTYGGQPPDEDDLRAAVRLGKERDLDEDVGFGMRQLVDIAERALSPGTNDPTTAVQAVDHLHDLLRRLATRPLPLRVTASEDGRVTVAVPQPGFSDYLALAVDEVARWGEDSERIQQRLQVMLADLAEVALAPYRPAITAQQARWPLAGAQQRSGDDPAPSDTGLRPAPAAPSALHGDRRDRP